LLELKLLLDPYIVGVSVLYLIGSVMDWREDDFTPASCSTTPMKAACGCGESFTI
jgi:iron-sulfur cluster assembly protein